MTLKDLNRAVCGLVREAAALAGLEVKLVEEDLSAPILRPSLKVELEDHTDARAVDARVERTVTFRVYFYAADRYRPKPDNLAMREALGLAFRDGIPVGEERVPVDEGLAFTVADGVLIASLDLALDLELPEEGEYMQDLEFEMEVRDEWQ